MKRKKSFLFRKGFSIVELIVATTIAVLLLGFVLNFYRAGNKLFLKSRKSVKEKEALVSFVQNFLMFMDMMAPPVKFYLNTGISNEGEAYGGYKNVKLKVSTYEITSNASLLSNGKIYDVMYEIKSNATSTVFLLKDLKRNLNLRKVVVNIPVKFFYKSAKMLTVNIYKVGKFDYYLPEYIDLVK